MSFKKSTALIILFLSGYLSATYGQQTKHYNLAKLLQQNKLITYVNTNTQALADGSKKNAISTAGIIWLKDVNFKDGTIDIDLRGKDEFLKSFVGIAFHATDTLNYEAVYFRPFRFHSDDVPTRKWSVQYMSLPGYNYDQLRKDSPGVYENEINPIPAATDWFHTTIVVKGEDITIYVNHSATPSLKVKKLNSLSDGLIGLWTSGLGEDFANLNITTSEP